jgi:hypothetical protein
MTRVHEEQCPYNCTGCLACGSLNAASCASESTVMEWSVWRGARIAPATACRVCVHRRHGVESLSLVANRVGAWPWHTALDKRRVNSRSVRT